VWFGAGTDQNLVPDPEMIMTGFHAEFEAIQHSVSELVPDLDGAVASKGSIENMNAMLDEAIARVDALLEGQEADPSQRAG
jgi:hypothetical protein